MITEWLVNVAAGFWGIVAGWFPDWTLPAELANPDNLMSQINGFASGLAPFVDWSFVALVGAIPLGVWATGLTIRAIQFLISHVPFFGGN